MKAAQMLGLLSAHFPRIQSGWRTSPPSAHSRRNPERATRKTCRSQRAPASLSSPQLHTKYQDVSKNIYLICKSKSPPKLIPQKHTEVIGTDLEGLGLSHDEADLGSLLMLEQLNGTRAALLPLAPVLVKSVQLRLPTDTRRSTEPDVSGLDQSRERSDRDRSSEVTAEAEAAAAYISRRTSSSSSPVVMATSSSFTMGAIWAPVSSSSPAAAASSSSSRCSAGSAIAGVGLEVGGAGFALVPSCCCGRGGGEEREIGGVIKAAWGWNVRAGKRSD